MQGGERPVRWSLRIAVVAGIGIYVHVTLLVFMAWIALSGAIASHDPAVAVRGVLLMAGLFGCVALHELGHALTARRYGIRTLDIILLPIGGIARLERMPEKPLQEIVVALAGPAVNLILLALLAGVMTLLPGQGFSVAQPTLEGGFLPVLATVNLYMFAFNLIPAFPMDGGRVLRALLAFRFPYARATEIAATIGQGIAVLFAIVGIFNNPMLILIALFVFIAASEEWAVVQTRTSLSGLPVSAAMITHFRALEPSDSLARAVDHLMEGYQQDFPVVEGERVLGTLTRADLLLGLAQSGPQARVGEIVRSDPESAAPNDSLELTVRRMQAAGKPTLPVLSQGHLVGLLSNDNVAELLMVKSALAKRAKTA